MLKLRYAPAIALGFVIALHAPSARAQSEQEMAARGTLLEQAQQAREANDHARALDAATRAGRIRMTASVRLFIAEEHESLAHIAESVSSADLCVREATRDTTLRNREAILGSCTAIVTRLRPRVGQIIVNLSAGTPPGLHVTVAGAEISDALFGIPYMVNPGAVAIDAQAPGFAAFHRDVRVESGQTVNVGIELRAGASSATMSTSTPPVGGPVDPGRGHGPGAGPWVVMGIGAATLGASLVLFLLRNDAIGSCATENDELVCPTQAAADRAGSAPTLNAATNVTLGVGAAALVGGGLWFLLGGGLSGGGSSARRGATLDVTPDLGGGIRFNLRGSF